MQNQIDIIHDWIQEKGTPQLEAAARSALLKYPNLFDKTESGDPHELTIEAHQSIADLDKALVLITAMREKLQSLEG